MGRKKLNGYSDKIGWVFCNSVLCSSEDSFTYMVRWWRKQEFLAKPTDQLC